MNSLNKYLIIFSSIAFILLNQNLAYSQISIDGNPSEWPGVLNNAANTKKAFKHDPFNANGIDDQWTQGSQDNDASPASNWKWVNGNSNDKGDIGNAGAVLLGTKLYFFGDRAALNGDAQIGFWFFLNDVMPTGSGASASPFVGEHANGDLLIISNFTNGGGNAQPKVYVWTGKTANNPGGLVQVNAATVSASIATNTAIYNVPGGASGTPMFNGGIWTFSPKSGAAYTYPIPLFFEGSVDLATIPGISPCFKRFLLETRNSQSLNASLQDLTAGGFSGVPPPPSVVAGSRCGSGSVTLSASGCTGTLNWYANASGGPSLGSNSSFDTPSISQTTTFYVSCTSDGCEGSRAPVVATINPPPTAGASFTPILCYGANSTITASASGGTGPYTYSLDDLAYQQSNTFSVLAGSYTVYVKDSKGCKGNYPITISQPPQDQPDINIGPGGGVYCGLSLQEAQALLNSDFAAWLASLQIIDTGTSPYTIVRNPENPTPPNITNDAVTVTWTITDACGKTDVTSGTFTTSNCTIECLLQSTPTPCNVPGSISATASNGIPPYSYKLFLTSDVTFSNQIGSTLTSNQEPGTVNFTGLAAGNYTVLMLDQVQNTNDTATACSKIVSRIAPPPVTKHCSDDQFTACGLTQEALNSDYASWFASLAPTGGTNLQYSIEVKDAQGNVVDIDGVFAPNKCGAVYTATVTYSDDCAQSGSCQGTYTVVGDTEIPVISTQNQSGYLGCNPQSIVPPSFSANDNCDGVLQPAVSDGGVQSEGCGRSQTWTATVSDGCGNAATPKSITYTWKVDTDPPVISTQNQNGDLGCNPQSIVPPSFNATDNCDGTLQPSVSDGGVQSNGCGRSQTWTASVSDGCGNAATPKSITYIWKVDTDPPVISTQNQNGDLGCNPTSIVPPSFTANDNCDGELQPAVSDGGVQSNGCGRSQTWTATVSDGCGNAATPKIITYTWKVDTDPPVISTQNQNGDLGCNPQSIVPPSFSATDNCDGILQPSVSDGGLQSNGCGRSQTWTASVSDGCGNAAIQKSITYTWKVDITKPVISSQNQSGDLGCNPTSIVSPSFTANDNCDGALQPAVNDSGVQSNGCGRSQTWTATVSDGCGNAATPKIITYTWKVDTTPPVFTCPSNYTLKDCDPQPILVLPLATDDCDGQIIVTGVRSDNLALNAPFPINQTLTVTYSAVDGCGNPASCSFTVYVTPCIIGKACTPGFWKNHRELWDAQGDFTVNGMPGALTNPVTPGGTFVASTNFFTYFGISPSSAISTNGNLTMLEAVALGGGDCKALARHGVSALLGAAAFPDDYPFDAAGVANFDQLYSKIKSAFLSGNCASLANTLANINNLDGPFCSALSKLPDARIQVVYDQVESPTFTVYPVPFRDNFTILYEFDYTSDVLIQVFDPTGNLLLSKTDKDAYRGKEITIDFPLTHQKGQIFFIRVETNKGHYIRNIVSSTN